MDVRDTIIHPCDMMEIPVFATYRSAKGIVAQKAMFYKHNTIILRYVEDDCRNNDILVHRPETFVDGKNYWDSDNRKWAVS